MCVCGEVDMSETKSYLNLLQTHLNLKFSYAYPQPVYTYPELILLEVERGWFFRKPVTLSSLHIVIPMYL